MCELPLTWDSLWSKYKNSVPKGYIVAYFHLAMEDLVFAKLAEVQEEDRIRPIDYCLILHPDACQQLACCQVVEILACVKAVLVVVAMVSLE